MDQSDRETDTDSPPDDSSETGEDSSQEESEGLAKENGHIIDFPPRTLDKRTQKTDD